MAEWGWWTMQILTPVIVIVGIIGNILSFRVMKSKRLKHKSYSHLLCALACFDSLSLIGRQIDITNELVKWKLDHNMFRDFSNESCKVFKFFENMCYLMSAWLIVSIAFERLFAVCFPFKKFLLRTQSGAIFTVLLLFALLSITQAFILVAFGNIDGTCTALEQHLAMYTKVYIYFYQFTLIFALPFLLVFCCNVMVIYQIYRIRREAGNTSASSERRTHKTTFMLLTISFAYVVFMLPLFVVSAIVHTNTGSMEGIMLTFKLKPFTEFFSVVSYMNYGINFFIYILCGRSFRVELRRLFVRKRNLSITGTRTRTKEELIRLQ